MAVSVVQSAVQWIGYLLIQEAGTLFEVDDQVRGLQEELSLMQQYLQDADAKQEEGEVRTMVCQIRKLVYDAEDVIDSYILKVHSKAQRINASWLRRFAFFLYSAPNIYELGKEIQVIQTDVKRISDRFSSIGMRRSRFSQQGLDNPRSYPYDDDNDKYVVGLEKDIQKLVEMLVSSEGKEQVINVLSIVGMGGSGKTTLARMLYNHPYVKEAFECAAWIFISKDWRTRHVLSEILRKVGGPDETSEVHSRLSIEELVDKLRSILKEKRYLIVLDDVWRREALQEILPALPSVNDDDHRGSKIIITTRNREISQFQNFQKHLHIYEPLPFDEEEGWKLLKKIALDHRKIISIESFEILGKEMVKKCDGLPLAVVALAGILSTRESIVAWQQVSQAVRSRVLDGTCTNVYGRVGELLALSFEDLPYELKPCFLHLAVFPEDCQIPVGMLIRMWIAEGFVSPHGGMSLEDIAMRYLEGLSHRFMVQVVRTNYIGVIKAVRMHDLLRDLCVRKAKEQSFLQVYTPLHDLSISDLYASLSNQPRRAALHSRNSLPVHPSHLRSLVLLTRASVSCAAYKYEELGDFEIVPHNFKLLRLLNLWGIKITSGVLPGEIGSLIHLRYLEIRASNITVLPSSIGNLRNLLTLDYRDIISENKAPIIKIPNVFGKLVLLRHLFLPIEYPWRVEELKLSSIPNLQTLWGVKQDGSQGYWLSREILNLSAMLKKLKIMVSSERELEAVFSCPCLMSDALNTFYCKLRGSTTLCNVAPLFHRQNLHKMTLIGQISMKLSLLLPSNLIILKLKDSMLKDDDLMIVLGTLAHLKFLSLSNAFVGARLGCNTGTFSQLVELYIESLQNLEMLTIEKGAMPCLKKLGISGCWRLLELPRGLEFLKTLEQLEYSAMSAGFREKATENGCLPQKLRLPQDFRLPHNCAAIVAFSDSAVDSSSIHKLYEQLTAGIFLNNTTKKYWVTKQERNYINCFMVYALGLRVCTQLRCLRTKKLESLFRKIEDMQLAKCREVTESVGGSTKITVVEMELNTYFEVVGNINIADISSQVTYEAVWIIMLESFYPSLSGLGTDPTYIEFQLSLPGGSIISHKSVTMDSQPLNKWLRIQVGTFKMNPSVNGELQLSLSCVPGTGGFLLVIKGFAIQPKAITG